MKQKKLVLIKRVIIWQNNNYKSFEIENQRIIRKCELKNFIENEERKILYAYGIKIKIDLMYKEI